MVFNCSHQIILNLKTISLHFLLHRCSSGREDFTFFVQLWPRRKWYLLWFNYAQFHPPVLTVGCSWEWSREREIKKSPWISWLRGVVGPLHWSTLIPPQCGPHSPSDGYLAILNLHPGLYSRLKIHLEFFGWEGWSIDCTGPGPHLCHSHL